MKSESFAKIACRCIQDEDGNLCSCCLFTAIPGTSSYRKRGSLMELLGESLDFFC
jgi:hypothetical protein